MNRLVATLCVLCINFTHSALAHRSQELRSIEELPDQLKQLLLASQDCDHFRAVDSDHRLTQHLFMGFLLLEVTCRLDGERRTEYYRKVRGRTRKLLFAIIDDVGRGIGTQGYLIEGKYSPWDGMITSTVCGTVIATSCKRHVYELDRDEFVLTRTESSVDGGLSWTVTWKY